MIVHKKKDYTFISSEKNSLTAFKNLLFENINDFKSVHLVIEINQKIITKNKDFSLFLKLAAQKKKSGTSFVIVNSIVNADDFPDHINIVPTLQEAEDILEMEAIERKLGF